jgi:hypothetical protein
LVRSGPRPEVGEWTLKCGSRPYPPGAGSALSFRESGVELNSVSPANGARRNGQGGQDSGNDAGDVLNALAGKDADRDRAVAQRTRRVVLSSLGVLKEQQADRSRVRAVALAFSILLLLLVGPLLWEATDSLIAGEHFGDPGNLWSMWAVIACPTLLGAVLVAGWWRKRG